MTQPHLLLSGLALALALGLAACDSGTQDGTSHDPALVMDKKWTVTEVAGTSVIEESRASFTFTESGGYGGNASCNSMSGRAEFGPGEVTLHPGIMTKMACMDPVMAQENAVVQALETTKSWALDDEELIFYGADGTPVMRFVSIEGAETN